MAERSAHRPEHHKPQERQELHQERQAHRATPEHDKPKAEQLPVSELEQRAKQEAMPASEAFQEAQETPQAQSRYIGRQLKQQALQRTLTRVRKQLSAPGRAFSKVIHQPVVDSISQATGKTVARPSGLLGGSLCAFLGSSVFLWMARHYGFTYNYLLFVFLFIGGFAIGMILELSLFALRRKKV